MKLRILLAYAAVVLALIPTVSFAQEKPFNLALVTPIQIFSEETAISGMRINLLYGRNTTVNGIDFGLVNHTTSGQSMGLQWGGLNMTDADFTGLQYGWVNITKQNFKGMQWGLVNYVNSGNGFMLGFVNYAMTMKGLQIGLINFIRQGGQFPVFPIVNWSF